MKSETLDLSFISNFQHFYKPEYVTNKEVRKSWFYFCFYFLPICNKDWKDHIQMDRLNKTEIIYRQVTTSDEAIVNFFLQLWAPKIQIEKDSKWTTTTKFTKDGDQELKARLNEYSAIYQSITKYKSHNKGEFATIWNDIFWEEVQDHFPKAFQPDEINESYSSSLPLENEDVLNHIPLPGIDDDSKFSLFVEERKLSKISYQPDNQAENNIFLDKTHNESEEIKNENEDTNSIEEAIAQIDPVQL